MCFTYRIFESMDSNIHLSMFSPALEKATSKAEVQFPSVFVSQSTPSVTVNKVKDSNDSDDDSSDNDEFFDALTGEDLEWLTIEDLQNLSPVEEDWAEEDTGKHTEEDDSHTEADNTETDNTETDNTAADGTEAEPDHPLAGWHSERLAQSDWTDHSFIDKSDHIDTWSRHTEHHLARCTWCVYPESAWPKPESDCWGAPELRLITPEGDVCWLDDPTDYESLPWEREVADERDRMLAAIW